MKLEEKLSIEELLNKKPDYNSKPVYKPTGTYYNETNGGKEDDRRQIRCNNDRM